VLAIGFSALACNATDAPKDETEPECPVDLLFEEPSSLTSLENGDTEYSLTYTNNGPCVIQASYQIRLRLLDRFRGQDQAPENWPQFIEGQGLEPGESATLSGVISAQDKAAEGRFLNVILDSDKVLNDPEPYNNKFVKELPGTLIEDHCETQVNEDWGIETLNRPAPNLDAAVLEFDLNDIIAWDESGNRAQTFDNWPDTWKQELQAAFEEAWNWYESGTPALNPGDRPENLFASYCQNERCTSSEGHNTYFSLDDARQIYMKQVAGYLAARKGEWFSWTNTDNAFAFVNFLLRNKMTYVPSVRDSAVNWMNRPEILSEDDFVDDSEAILIENDVFADMSPIEVLSFMKENQLIGQTDHDTAALVLAWSRRLTHVAGAPYSIDQREEVWGYTGMTPLSAMLYGTVSAEESNVNVFGRVKKHWTFGCWGTGEFLKQVLMPAGILTAREKALIDDKHATGGHVLNYFVTEQGRTFLSHNDDPYNLSLLSMSHCPEEILNPSEKVDEWFLSAPDAETASQAVGRRIAELDVERISGQMLKTHCGDVEKGLEPAESKVASTLKNHYSVEELQAMNLWERLKNLEGECGRFDSP
jgi:hypothetical protein